MKQVKKLPGAAAGLFLGACLFSAVLYAKNSSTERTLFYFRSFDRDDLCTEMRYLPRNPVQGEVRLFVDELLLGPMTNRYKSIFVPGTQAEFCIVEGDTLYLGLSREALQVDAEMESIRDSVALLKRNIVKRFTKINTVLVYIDGKSAF